MNTATAERENRVEDIEVREKEVREAKAHRIVVLRPATPEIGLFADVLLESSATERRRRGFAAILSLVFQCSLLGVAVLIPLWFTDALPKQEFLSMLVAPPPPPPPPPAALASRVVQRVVTEMVSGELRAPERIPTKVQMIREEEPAPSVGVVGGVPGGVPGGQLGGVIGGILGATANIAAVPKLSVPQAPQRIRISQVTRGQILEKVEAKYPPLALQARVQGDVILQAIISKTGEIQNLELVSGSPMLVPAAIHAVQQWRYKPFLLNGVPVEVETVVTVTFHIAT